MIVDFEGSLTLELRVELTGTDPEVYRVIRVPADINLAQLHEILQVAMGWENYHLWCFVAGDRRYEEPPRESAGDPHRTALRRLLRTAGDCLIYIYDFGDGWRHTVQVQKVIEGRRAHLTCIAAGGACPPEDAGGIDGYRQMLDALQDEEHPRNEEVISWLGRDFDPAKCKRTAVNRRLRETFIRQQGDGEPGMSLEEIFLEFLLQQKESLSQKEYSDYQANVALLRTALNNHAHEHVDVSPAQLQKDEHTLCDAAGPDVIPDYLPSFFKCFLPRQSYVSAPHIGLCGTIIRRLLLWMGEQDLLDEKEVAAYRSRVLHMTEAAQLAARARTYCDEWPDLVPPGEPAEFYEDNVTIRDVEPGRLKLEEHSGSFEFGWVDVPSGFTEMCCEGMELAVEMQRFGGQWYLTDVFTVYPVMP